MAKGKNGYVVHFGTENTQVAIVATPDKVTGQPTGEVAERHVTVGTHQIINRARVWGRRVMGKDNEVTAMPDGGEILFSTPGYRGEIEFMDWGTEGGHAIETRYVPQSGSLDYEFQENVQKIKIDPANVSPFLDFKTGKNELDYKKDALKIKFLKNYPSNRDSKSKNPDPLVKGFKFYEVTDEHVDQTSIKRIEGSSEAVRFVMQVSNRPGALKCLLKCLGKKLPNVSELSLDLEIYKALMEYANSDPGEFFQLIDAYKLGVFDDFEKAKSYKALDLTKHGHVAFVYEGKPTLVMSDVKAKGEEMINWMVENFCEEEVYKATQIFKELVSKLK
jgi:hypothetical protein